MKTITAKRAAKFETMLTGLFERVEPEFRRVQHEKYRAEAAAQLKGWLTRLEGPPPTGMFAWELAQAPEFVRLNHGPGHVHYLSTWEQKQQAAAEGRYVADYDKARREADASVDQAKAHFIAKQTKKLANATKNCESNYLRIEGTLAFDVLITGHLDVHVGNKRSFRLAMSMIVNHRYTRGFKSFYQFPACFTDVVIRGEWVGNVSEAWMSENFK